MIRMKKGKESTDIIKTAGERLLSALRAAGLMEPGHQISPAHIVWDSQRSGDYIDQVYETARTMRIAVAPWVPFRFDGSDLSIAVLPDRVLVSTYGS